MYNVLWFEDEDYKFVRFKEISELKGFDLIPVGVRQRGIDELKLHPGKYDAILLDAEMPEKTENEKAGTSGIMILNSGRKALAKISVKPDFSATLSRPSQKHSIPVKFKAS